MATAAQIEANRRNAARSTGPTSDQGKARSRLNAYRNGSRSRIIMPGLPHENPERIQQRTEQYLDDLQPRDSMELDLVHQMARLSLAVERAERMEIAHMADRVNQATKQRLEEPTAEQRKQVRELGRKLLYIAAAEDIKVDRVPPRGDDPAQLVDELEASSEGCRWLLERWDEYRCLLERQVKWDEPMLLRFFRLQGKEVVEAVYNGSLNAIFQAWDVLVAGYAKEAWKFFRKDWPMTHPADSYWLTWREIAPRPANASAAWALLQAIVAKHVERLKTLLTERLDFESVVDPDWTDRAALDFSREFERHRRYQSAKTRELLRTVEAFCKVRKAAGDLGTQNAECPMTDDECQKEDGRCLRANGGCQRTEDLCRMTDGECPMTDGECLKAECEYRMGDETELAVHNSQEMADEVCQVTAVVVEAESQDSEPEVEGSADDAISDLTDDETATALQKSANEAKPESPQKDSAQEIKEVSVSAAGRERSHFRKRREGRGLSEKVDQGSKDTEAVTEVKAAGPLVRSNGRRL